MTNRPVVLDTTVLLNLLATGSTPEILSAIPVQFLICPAVQSEAMHLRSGDPSQPHELVSLVPLMEMGLLIVTELEAPREPGLYVQFAADLDDGEAMSLAISHARGFVLATDDRKACKIASGLTPEPVSLLATPEIIHHWSDQLHVGADRLRTTIQSIERRARFSPGAGHRLREWWHRSKA